eukprot:Phypoly_transcript_09754.p1 GENE.Phypoly_transcript_09754~~Phypoly_transcript_09754.p1  ORF type:complete len:340 (+),score=62.35 Phypoly_transcript_09754:58-1077(+)
MENLPSELMINIITIVMRQRRHNGKSSKHHPVKKKLADAYVQWACLRLVSKRWYGMASLCVVYPKYERKKLVYLAKVAEEANQYEEMVEIVNSIATMNEMEMSQEERQTFADAYKHLTHTKRLSWKTLQTIEQQLIDKYNRTNPHPYTSPFLSPAPPSLNPTSAKKEEKLVSKCCGGVVKESNIGLASKYRIKIEDELRGICKSVFEILETSIVPHIVSTEGKVFFIKMRADYLRYLAEIATEQSERQDYVGQAQRSYAQASRLATVELRPSHPLCLSLGLSFALFFSEVLNEPDRGAKMAKATFDAAVGEMEMDARRQSAGNPMWTDDMLDDLRSPKK